MDKHWWKAITWNTLALGITLSVSYAITRQVHISLGIGILERAIKVAVYYLHEKAWENR